MTPSSTGTQIILTLLFPPMFYTFFTKALASFENIPLTPDILRRSPDGDAPVLALLIVAIVSHPFRFLGSNVSLIHVIRSISFCIPCLQLGSKLRSTGSVPLINPAGSDGYSASRVTSASMCPKARQCE